MISYLISWTGTAQRSDLQVETFSHPTAAKTALATMEKTNLERTGRMVDSVKDLEGVGGTFLVELYNTVTGESQKGFHDIGTGRRKVWEALTTKYPDPDPVQPAQDEPTDQQEGQAAADVPAAEEGTTDMATKKAARSATKGKKVKKESGAPRKPGVIDAIVDILSNGGGTIAKMAEKLAKKFPDRDAAGLLSTLKIQVNRLSKSKDEGGRNLKIKRDKVEGSNELSYHC